MIAWHVKVVKVSRRYWIAAMRLTCESRELPNPLGALRTASNFRVWRSDHLGLPLGRVSGYPFTRGEALTFLAFGAAGAFDP